MTDTTPKLKVLMPLPAYGFDPTETAIPWKVLSSATTQIIFATPAGQTAEADKLMVTGKGLGIWSSVLRARKDAVVAYQDMIQSEQFCQPIRYDDIDTGQFDALILPGGHDKGVREFLESVKLQECVVDFFNDNKPVGAICHGVILAARSINPATGKSVLHGRKTTALLKSQEKLAHFLTKLWLKDYYRTYPGDTVEDEVRRSLARKRDFKHGPSANSRDSLTHLKRGFVVKDGAYISARWPGDAYRFSVEFNKILAKIKP